MKTVCFIGHRNFQITKEKADLILLTLTKLIDECGAKTFIFGSHSKFDSACYTAITALQTRYKDIERVVLLAPHETAITSQKVAKAYSEIAGEGFTFEEYERMVKSERSIRSRKNTYMDRNKEMIDMSDACVFYYNENYKPQETKIVGSVLTRQSNSGTAIAYKYAKQKDKKIINLYI